MRYWSCVLTTALLALTGCASDPEGTGNKFEEAPQIAESLGCTGSDMEVAPNVAPSKFAAQTVRCNARGDIGYVTVDYFEDAESRDKHVDLGVSRGQLFVVGEPWTVNVDTERQLKAVVKIVGGKATIDESGEVVIP